MAASSMLLAGCWPAAGQGPDRQAHNPFESQITPATVATLEPAWTASLGDGAAAAPVVSGPNVVVGDGVTVYGIEAATGTQLWTRTTEWPGIAGLLVGVAAGGRVLVTEGTTGGGGTWYTDWVDASTGVSVESIRGGIVDSARGSWILQRNPGAVIAGEWDGFQVTDLATGARGGTAYLGSSYRFPMTLGTERAYHANEATIAAYTAREDCGPTESCLVWATSLAGQVTGPPVLASDESTVYVGSSAGSLYALDAGDGDVLWTAELGGAPTAEPALADGTLFVPTAGSGGDRLVAVAAAGCGSPTCPASWTAPVGGRGRQPAVAGGVVFVGTDGGTVDAVVAAGCGAATCPAVWSADVGAAVTGAPVVTGGRLFVGTGDGRLLAYAPS
ncbi:MAG TPA: PQQ-binding-like beta-propeller repeat protein [Acidimicrobiales bacterium]|nr:PQQ-binding-like beta-propeller repeat protein [Acidimicrobiales bacterium]